MSNRWKEHCLFWSCFLGWKNVQACADVVEGKRNWVCGVATWACCCENRKIRDTCRIMLLKRLKPDVNDNVCFSFLFCQIMRTKLFLKEKYKYTISSRRKKKLLERVSVWERERYREQVLCATQQRSILKIEYRNVYIHKGEHVSKSRHVGLLCYVCYCQQSLFHSLDLDFCSRNTFQAAEEENEWELWEQDEADDIKTCFLLCFAWS